jgi:hypothetical protein
VQCLCQPMCARRMRGFCASRLQLSSPAAAAAATKWDIKLVAGIGGQAGRTTSSGPALQSSISQPCAVTRDSAGNLYVLERTAPVGAGSTPGAGPGGRYGVLPSALPPDGSRAAAHGVALGAAGEAAGGCWQGWRLLAGQPGASGSRSPLQHLKHLLSHWVSP